MVVSSIVVKNSYTANGVNTSWDYTFPVDDPSYIQVYVTDLTGVQTQITSNFTVDTVGLHVIYPSVISGLPAVTSGYVVTLLRATPKTQLLNLSNQGAFDADNIEAAFDKVTEQNQEVGEALGRAILYPVGATPANYDPTSVLSAATSAAASAVSATASAQTATTQAGIATSAAATFTKASQAEAQAGSNDAHYMTALKANQAIQALKVRQVALTDGSSVATDATLGDVFTLTTTQNFTLSNPTGAVNGQKLIWKITQNNVGSKIITLGNAFKVSSEINAVVLSTAAGSVDWIGAVYDGTYFNVIAFSSKVA